MIKNFPYSDIDGEHWADAALDSAEYYSLDLGKYLDQENDVKTSVQWVVPVGLTGSDAFEDATNAYIKLQADKRGSHKVLCKVTSTEAGKSQVTVIPIILKVY